MKFPKTISERFPAARFRKYTEKHESAHRTPSNGSGTSKSDKTHRG
jgi:hypothetical protein